jgi:hypothetical protein
VDRRLPELADRRVVRGLEGPLDDTVPADRPISVRDLMTLRFGLGFIMAQEAPLQQAFAERGLAPGPDQPDFADADAYMAAFAELPLAGPAAGDGRPRRGPAHPAALDLALAPGGPARFLGRGLRLGRNAGVLGDLLGQAPRQLGHVVELGPEGAEALGQAP